MVEFRTEYYTPMERQYHERIEVEPTRPKASIEEPIVPINRLGQTVPEHDPTGRFKNILQNVQAAIRHGAGNLQIVMQTPPDSAIGGRPKAYGKEIRQAIKEVSKANEALISSFEMPTALSNLSGWDPQRGIVDETKRQRDLEEVKETIRFAAEAAEGGGVDIVSFEYDRPVHRAQWLEKDPVARKAFERQLEIEKTKADIRFVNKRSGQILSVPRVPVFRQTKEGNFREIDPQKGAPVMWEYKDFADYAKKEGTTVHEIFKEDYLKNQLKTSKAEESRYMSYKEEAEDRMKQLQEMPQSAERDTRIESLRRQKEAYESGIEAQKRHIVEIQDQLNSLVPMENYILDKTRDSFAEAGMSAMHIQEQMGPKHIRRDLYVGPEIGWPQYYGGHPKEFVQLIKDSRNVMTQKLVAQGYAPATAEEEAKRHIKGVFDTSHLGMWLQNFHPDLPWDKRLKKFNKWYKEQVEWLAKENKKHELLGGVQAVDSAGPGHGHIPAGQGILPVVDAVKILQNKGNFTGYIVSEGHEEEKFGEGRILMKTWEAFNAPIGSTGYVSQAPRPQRWTDVHQSYFGRTYSPMFMFGAYAPSNDFKLWSEVPFE